MSEKFQFMEEPLRERRERGELRELRQLQFMPNSRVLLQGKELINFSSNDYLGLAERPELRQRAEEYMQAYGAGVRASRLVTGNIQAYRTIEEKLARLKGSEAALLFNSGFQANVSLIPMFAGPNSLILMDRLIHNSMIQGALLSRAKLSRFRHNDLDHLQEQLEKAKEKGYDRILILAESVYSMDGDRADVAGLKTLSDRYEAILLIDEAHATGVLGPQGMGLASKMGVDLVMGTFGKGLGSFGAYLACSAKVREYLINYCSGLIYTTALPPQVLGSIEAALDLVPTLEEERKILADKAESFRREIQKIGLSPLDSSTQIVPVLLGESQRALDCANYLKERGYLAMAIRPPTVEEGKARLRIAFNLLHDQKAIDGLIEALRSFVEAS